MADEPKFFDKNFIDEAAVLTASSGQATAGRIRDRDTELQWVSSGSDDLTTETIQFDFKSGGLDFLRTFDFLAVLNHNLKNFKFRHDVGAGFVDTPGATITGETAAFNLIPISEIADAKAALLSMDTTQIVDDEKRVGEVLVLKRLLELPSPEGLARLGIEFPPVAKVTSMLDNGVKVNLLKWAGNRVERYRANIAFQRLSKTLYDSLRTVLKKGVYIIQPEPVERPQEFFLVTHVPNGFRGPYASTFKPAGYNVELIVQEV